MKYFKIVTLLSIVLFFASCEDFFDQTTTIDIPPHTPKLGVTALWIGDGDEILVTVFSSVGALDDETSSAVSEAVIILSENGTQLATFEENSSRMGHYQPVSLVNLVAGRTYELSVSATNFETVTATQVMPEEPTIKSAKYVKANNKLHLTISDMEREDFYLLGIVPSGSTHSNGYIYSEGGIAEESGLDSSRLILRDETFSGNDISQVYDAHLNSGSGGQTDSVIVNLYGVTSDYYRLDRTLWAANKAVGNPFAEPVIMHRNFENGYGVFALGNKKSLTIPVE